MALIGRIGSTTFLLGSSGSFVAPESGELLLGVNDDFYLDNSGAFDVTLGVEVFYTIDRTNRELLRVEPCSGQFDVLRCYDRPLRVEDMTALNGSLYAVTSLSELLEFDPRSGELLSSVQIRSGGSGVYPEGVAAVGDGLVVSYISASQAGKFQIPAVNGCGNWIPTGLTIGTSDPFGFVVQALGTVELAPGACAYGAGGVPGTAGDPALCRPSSNAGALLGMVNGVVFEIGDCAGLPSPATGQLFLGINDSNHGDNSGELTVWVTTLTSGRSDMLADLALDGTISNAVDWDTLGVDFGGDLDELCRGPSGSLVSVDTTNSSYRLYELDRTSGSAVQRASGAVFTLDLTLANSGDLVLNSGTRTVAIDTTTSPGWTPFAPVLLEGPARNTQGFASALLVEPPMPPALMADVASVSACAGGVQRLCLNAGRVNAGRTYVILSTASGTLPGPRKWGMLLPLNRDPFVLANFLSGFPHPTSGVLDSAGRASRSLDFPAGADPSLIGMTFLHAFGLFAAPPSRNPGLSDGLRPDASYFVSNLVPLLVTP